MTTETKKQTLLEKYKDKLEFAKEISSLSSDQKQFLFNKDFQEAFDKITGFVADKVVTNGQSQAIKYKYAIRYIRKKDRKSIRSNGPFWRL